MVDELEIDSGQSAAGEQAASSPGADLGSETGLSENPVSESSLPDVGEVDVEHIEALLMQSDFGARLIGGPSFTEDCCMVSGRIQEYVKQYPEEAAAWDAELEKNPKLHALLFAHFLREDHWQRREQQELEESWKENRMNDQGRPAPKSRQEAIKRELESHYATIGTPEYTKDWRQKRIGELEKALGDGPIPGRELAP